MKASESALCYHIIIYLTQSKIYNQTYTFENMRLKWEKEAFSSIIVQNLCFHLFVFVTKNLSEPTQSCIKENDFA